MFRLKTRVVRKLSGLLAACISLSGLALAQQTAIGGYGVPTFNSFPTGITVGPDGALWFTEQTGNNIGRMTTAGASREYPIPTATSFPYAITTGPDGALWFTEYDGNKIGRLTLGGVMTEYGLPPASRVSPQGITAGPDGALWFTVNLGSQIGRITTHGAMTLYPLRPDSGPEMIVTGPDGALWFTEGTASKIGRITTGGAITEYALALTSGPDGITVGPDGALWFTQMISDQIGRITTSGAITLYNVPTANAGPAGITVGPDGALWFTEVHAGNNIGRITTSGAISEYPIPVVHSAPFWITSGPDGALWFTENIPNKIGQLVFPTAGLTVTPSTAAFHESLTFMGTGYAPNEPVSVYRSGVGSPVLVSGAADSTGAFSLNVTAPQSANGPRLFLGVGQTSGLLGAASFSATARMILTPNAGTAGSLTAPRGFGFGAGEPVEVFWNTALGLVFSASADINGSINADGALKIAVPSNANTGRNIVMGVGQATAVRGYGVFTVQ